MTALSNVKPEPNDPVRGIVDDLALVSGLPTIGAMFGWPSDMVNTLGLPTMQQIVPTPYDTVTRLVKDFRAGRAPTMPPTPPVPPGPLGLLPRPGEALPFASMERSEMKAETGMPPGQMGQRAPPGWGMYYGKPPFVPPL